MTVQARFRQQRRVTRASWKVRFTKQRVNNRGSTSGTALTLPTLASISPTTTTAAALPRTVTCTGTNYITGITKVTVGLVDMPTTFVSATSVTFTCPPAVAGTLTVNVRNGTKFSTTPRTLTVT
ncbi:MAG TPA: IPT/TIG domain-containing protein [Nitrospiraceae bacterium]|nr:IPT/TIG domain-containing protein [Nitrospiraceae bacterium]